jgi:hypothetical protein
MEECIFYKVVNARRRTGLFTLREEGGRCFGQGEVAVTVEGGETERFGLILTVQRWNCINANSSINAINKRRQIIVSN